MTIDPERRLGLLQGVLAYVLWGVVAVYWKLLGDADPLVLLAHRALWGLLTFAAIVIAFGRWGALIATLREPRTVVTMAVSGALLAVNWGIFVWATVQGHLLEASLGYFITPLLSVALGTIVLGERLRRLQWIALSLAFAGVAVMTWRVGRLPWVSLVLALSFGLYGLVRKTARAEALVGSTVETLLLAPFAAVFLATTDRASVSSWGMLGLLAGSGVITAVPLVLFTSSARRLPLSTLGFLQYLAPTGQFVLAVVAYGEPLEHDRLAAFALIWVGLAAFSLDLVRARPRP